MCGLDGEFHLGQGGLDDDIPGLLAAQQSDAPGIDEGEGPPGPFGLGGNAVARDPGLIMDNSDAPADDAVEQGRLADIGSADDGNQARHKDKMPHREGLRKEKMSRRKSIAIFGTRR